MRVLTDEEEKDLQYHYDELQPRATAQLAALEAALQGEAVARAMARRSNTARTRCRARAVDVVASEPRSQ
eukprot:7234852-Prymnesium_polylepis.1